ncbi:MAG TPA: cyclic nucleotide-binding domain-containing protein [Polyangiaceae bacterium]
MESSGPHSKIAPDGPVRPKSFETVLAALSIFERLRVDEIGRIARRFKLVELEKAGTIGFAKSVDAARIVVVVTGTIDLFVTTSAGVLESTLEAGDRFGEMPLLSGVPQEMKVVAEDGAVLALLDRAELDAILEEFPVVALSLAVELASECSSKNDLARQLMELHAEGLDADELGAAIAERRRALARRGARVRRQTTKALFDRLVVREGAEPPFWMLTGFVVALAGARLVVALILKYGLQKQLFALVQGGDDPNPMHVHHFNYGMILIGLSGLAALFPIARKALRPLGFAFGVGLGLVFDEFALIWNLNPEYAQSLSLIAAAIAAAVLLQVTYFRAFWTAILRRGFYALRSGR